MMAAPPPVNPAPLLAVAAAAVVGACVCSYGTASTCSSSGDLGARDDGSSVESTTTADCNNAPSSGEGRRRDIAPAPGPTVRSFGSAAPPAGTASGAKSAAPRPVLQQTETPVAAPDKSSETVRIVQEHIKLRSNAGRFSPVVSAPAGSKLPGYDRKPPAGGRRQVAPLVVGTSVRVVEKGADRGGAPWLRVKTPEGVEGWLAQSSVELQPRHLCPALSGARDPPP